MTDPRSHAGIADRIRARLKAGTGYPWAGLASRLEQARTDTTSTHPATDPGPLPCTHTDTTPDPHTDQTGTPQ